MPLESIATLLARARAGGYALGYFESWNLESLQGAVDAAEAARSPIILGFNGDFLSRPGRLAAERLDWYGALGRAAAMSATVPCGLIFNECPDDAWVGRAADAGFNLVMPADPAAPPRSTSGAWRPSCATPTRGASRSRPSWANCPAAPVAARRPAAP